MSAKKTDRLAQHGWRADTVSVADIKRAVCETFGIPLIEMVSERRQRRVSRPRQIAMYLSRELTPYSYPNIGHFFGDRDHTTVMHGVATVERLMSESKAFSTQIETLKAALVSSSENSLGDNAPKALVSSLELTH